MKNFKFMLGLLVLLLAVSSISSIGAGSASAATTTLAVTKEIPLYDEADLTAESGASLSPQTVTVLEERSNGWYKIETWLGDKWIAPNGIKADLTFSTRIFNEPSYLKSAGASLSPQTITILDKRTDGWWLVKTWLGDKWIAPNGITLLLKDTYTIYNDASFSSSTGASLTPQTVTAINQKADGWWQVKTWLGNKWINVNDLGFSVPLKIKDYVVSSTFGPRWGTTHYGIDLAKNGTVEIVAAAGGTVSKSYYSTTYGNCVIVRHSINGKTYETLYAHMSSRSVSLGQTVSKGQQLGYMGNTGKSEGQHLHFEIHDGLWNGDKSNAVDPSLYINF
ncbi:M23 family metallopeptidase [Bacillus infantis]|uniref:M23 family metallopeptidase n=1 Tax=Bacillus infantis TaxID=324767 RepID=UPI003CE86B1C